MAESGLSCRKSQVREVRKIKQGRLNFMNNETTQEILPVMVGTAGHVDHGKTSLVRNLTGFDTDRLQEEKERGLSIDLGVAPWRLTDGRLAGIIDVPGHMDFIRNMVAGASSIDVLMLVVAADDGVMPQTREHLEIVSNLCTPYVMAVLTKIDLVDGKTLELVRGDVSDFLKVSGFPYAPVISVSNQTGEGLEDVQETLEKLVSFVKRPPDTRAFRMSVRQGFQMKGYGTVLTGVPVSGMIKVGVELEILPAGTQTNLRSVQNYRQTTDWARGGISTGLNLRDVVPEDIKRGMAVAVSGIYKPTTSAVVFFQNLSEKFSFSRSTDVRFHCGTSAIQASAKLIDKEELPSGKGCFMQVKFMEPLVVAAGDRFILRRLSPSATLGGGVVLSARDYRLRRKVPFLMDRLRLACDTAKNKDYFLCELLAGPGAVLQTSELFRLTQYLTPEAEKLVKEKQELGHIDSLEGGGWIVMARVDEVLLHLKNHLQRYHENNKHTCGMEPGLVWQHLELPPGDFKKLFRILGADKEFDIQHGCLSLKGFQPVIDGRLIKLRGRILERLLQASPNWMAKNDLMEELGIGKADMRILVKPLQEEGSIMAIGNYYMPSRFLIHCRETLLRLFDQTPEVEIGMFRKATGLSRNPAITILEAFDSEGLTRRVGDKRILLRQKMGISMGGG